MPANRKSAHSGVLSGLQVLVVGGGTASSRAYRPPTARRRAVCRWVAAARARGLARPAGSAVSRETQTQDALYGVGHCPYIPARSGTGSIPQDHNIA